MPDNNPSDDIFKDLVKMMEELIRGIGVADHSHRFIGYTIVTGPGEVPRVIRTTEGAPCDITYELVEGPTHFFITVELPPDPSTASYVDFSLERVGIHVGGRETIVDLSAPIDVKHSSYQIRHGLLDIECRKK
jgi:hypothetical protein